MNGVVLRGGAYNNSSDRCICAGHRRNTYTRPTANSAVGFRPEWCIERWAVWESSW